MLHLLLIIQLLLLIIQLQLLTTQLRLLTIQLLLPIILLLNLMLKKHLRTISMDMMSMDMMSMETQMCTQKLRPGTDTMLRVR